MLWSPREGQQQLSWLPFLGVNELMTAVAGDPASSVPAHLTWDPI